MNRKLEGADVKNSARRVRIDITSNDIKKGKPLRPDACAAAECIKRSLGAKEVKVHRGVTYVKHKGQKDWTKYVTSSGLRLETIIFDRGGMFIPGEYDLQPVPSRMIAPKKPKSSRGLKPREARLARRRLVIPGVRKSARVGREKE